MDLLIVVRVRLQLQAVECDALGADGNLGQIGPNFGVESVLIHTQESRGVPEADQPSVNHGVASYRARLLGDFRTREAR